MDLNFRAFQIESPVSTVKSSIVMLLSFVALLSGADDTHGQGIQGRVIDAVSRRPIEGVEVVISTRGVLVRRALTDSIGRFRVAAPDSGTYTIKARRLGYLPLDSIAIRIGTAELIEVTLRLSVTAVVLEPILIDTRRTDPRHAATIEGFYARREFNPPIGNRRAVHRTDPEMANEFKVEDVLEWFPRRFGCTVLYLNGIRITEDRLPAMLNELPVSHLEGIEFYRYGDEAPLGMRQPPVPTGACRYYTNYSVLALWSARSD